MNVRPFRPWVIVTHSGRRVVVSSAHQCAVSPDGVLVVVALGSAGIEVLSSAEICAVEPAESTEPIGTARGDAGPRIGSMIGDEELIGVEGGTSGASMVAAGGNGRIRVFACAVAGRAGERVVTCVFEDARGAALLDLAGTGFDVHAVEGGENFLQAHCTHAGELGRVWRVIVWPGNGAPPAGTLETFAEAMGLDQLGSVLRGADEQFRARSKPPDPGAAYWRSIREDDRVVHGAEGDTAGAMRGEDDLPDAERWVVQTRRVEQGDASVVIESRLVDVARDEVVLDLFGVGASSVIRASGSAPGAFVLEVLRAVGAGGASVVLDARSRTARAVPGGVEMPLRLARRLLLNSVLYDGPDALRAALARGAHAATEPEARLVLEGGVVAELWPGSVARGLPFLTLRVLHGERVVLDLRGTEWGARVAPGSAGAISLRLLRSWRERAGEEFADELEVHARTRRVTSPTIPGITTLGVLQHLLREHAAPSVLRENLEEAMAAGARLPPVE